MSASTVNSCSDKYGAPVVFFGRVLPIVVLGRFVCLRFDDAPARLPPVV